MKQMRAVGVERKGSGNAQEEKPNKKQIRFQIKQPEDMIYIKREDSQLFPGLRNLILMKFDPALGRQKCNNAAATWTNSSTVS